MSASLLLRTARHGRGVSQRALAAATDQSQPGIAAIESGAHDTTVDRLDRLVRSLGHQVALLPSRIRTVSQVAADVRAALEAGSEERAFREVLQCNDDLARESPAVRVGLVLTRPLPTGDFRFDALLAAVIDYRLSVDGLPRPDWLDLPDYTSTEPWDVERLPTLRAQARRRTPRVIARHGVFLAQSELSSV